MKIKLENNATWVSYKTSGGETSFNSESVHEITFCAGQKASLYGESGEIQFRLYIEGAHNLYNQNGMEMLTVLNVSQK